MGVDFYTCAICKYNFPDCGDFVRCECGKVFCSDECANMTYDENDEGFCVICQKKNADDSTLLKFLLNHFNLTREQAVDMWSKIPDPDEQPDTDPEPNDDANADTLKEYEELYGKDELGHIWAQGWEDSDTPHPGFGTYGGYVGQCAKCGMYNYECYGSNDANPGKYEQQQCGIKIREY